MVNLIVGVSPSKRPFPRSLWLGIFKMVVIPSVGPFNVGKKNESTQVTHHRHTKCMINNPLSYKLLRFLGQFVTVTCLVYPD